MNLRMGQQRLVQRAWKRCDATRKETIIGRNGKEIGWKEGRKSRDQMTEN